MIRHPLIGGIALALTLGLSAASAKSPLLRGGMPASRIAAPVSACGTGGVCADFSAGQTFVQWPDAATAAPGASFRYRLYRSTSALDAGNCTGATLKAKYILNNSGQLIGGDPTVPLGSAFTQANRQANNSANPMAKIPDAALGGGALKQLTYGTGLQVYTAQTTENAYYCVVSTNTSDTSPSYIGAVGPIAESAATQQSILYLHRASGYGAVPAGPVTCGGVSCPIVFIAHQSAVGGGSAWEASNGDYWEWFGDTTEGWQDGMPRAVSVFKDGSNGGFFFPSLSGALVYSNRDTVWNPAGTGGLEGYHLGIGMSPLVGPANRFYPITLNSIQKQISWVASHYGGDLNKVHITGDSMGADAGAFVGSHATAPHIASVWMSHPAFQIDRGSAGFWPGNLWQAGWPFIATVAPAFATLGSNAAAVLMSDGSSWKTYIDIADFINTTSVGNDLPFYAWQHSKDDGGNLVTGEPAFLMDLVTLDAMQATHRGHAFAFFMGLHYTTYPTMGAINCDWTGAIAGICYNKSQFALNLPYIAFDHSSIDDNPGPRTAPFRDSAGVFLGDPVGAINAGFTWNVLSDTSGAFNFTVGNGWMSRSPTTIPATTIAGSLPANCTATSVALSDNTFGGNLLSTSVNNEFKIGSGATAEIVSGSFTGATFNITRCQLGTSGQAHSPGDPVIQYPSKPTGPNGGPYATMTVNVTPRRVQSFIKADGTVLSCTITPPTGGPTTQTPTVSSGAWTLTGVTIKSSGVTSIACS